VQILATAIWMRQRIIEETDGGEKDEDSGSDGEENDEEKIRKEAAKLKGPSKDAIAKFEDYREYPDGFLKLILIRPCKSFPM
jgi:replication fork protection complex subunit TIMELESS/Tof1/Swi1